MNLIIILLIFFFACRIGNVQGMDNDSGPIRKVIETKRLYARHFTVDDAPQLMPILGDKDVMMYTESQPFTLEEIRSFLKNNLITSYQTYGWGRYAVIKKDDGELIGFAGLSTKMLGNEKKQIDLGYGFAKKYWGVGYATEIARALVQYAQVKAQIPALIALIHQDNKKSIRVAQKVGFAFCKNCIYHDKLVQVYKIALNN